LVARKTHFLYSFLVYTFFGKCRVAAVTSALILPASYSQMFDNDSTYTATLTDILKKKNTENKFI
jgi:hypothetical protein